MKAILLGSYIFLFSVKLFGALPPEAQVFLDKTPEKKITLPVVVEAALKNSDGFQILGLDYFSAEIEALKVGAYTDTNFSLSGAYNDDNSVKTNGISPTRSKTWQYELGLQKNWQTGTTTSLGWVTDTTNLEFPSSAGFSGFSNLFVTNYKQSAASLQIQQDLLKNSFGYSFRQRMNAAKIRAKAIQWGTRDSIESLTMQFIFEFYGAWLAQQQVRSIASQVSRQERLVRILTKRSRKGVVEKPELIQFQALLTSTKSRLEVAKAALANQWEKLIVGLKLPRIFLQIDPIEVPTAIDNPVELSLRLCGLKEPRKTASIYSLEKQMEALDSDFKASKNDSLPDLKLIAGYRGNSIEGRASETIQNVLRGYDDNGFGRGPAWNVALQLKWPLDNSSSRAERAQKFIEKEKVAAQLRIAVDELKTQWMDSCRRLKMERNNERVYQSVVSDQKQRVRAEEKRFSLGRINVNDLVTAEDDLGNWEFMSQQKSVEVRQLAWQVQKVSGEMYQRLSPLVEQLVKSESL